MNNLAALSIDLDDTLWPIMPVIQTAEQQLYDWLATNCPRTTELCSPDGMGRLRDAVVEAYPQHAHDFEFLRRQVLRQLVADAHYPAAMVDQAYDVFFAARNAVTVFDDVIPTLQHLRRHYVLLAVTNGNADLQKIGLAPLFHHVIRAADVGAAKPDGRIFAATSAAAGVEPERILHIGDAPLDDVAGAAGAGMRTVWINRFGRTWPDNLVRADAEIQALAELIPLLPV